MPAEPSPARSRVVAAIFLPTFLFSVGEGAVLVAIPLVALDIGADIGTAALITSLLMIGTVVSDIPSGLLVSRIPESRAMMLAVLVCASGLTLAALLPSVPTLAVGVLMVGMGSSVFGVARHTYVTTHVPYHVRARTLASLNAVIRAGQLAGPFLTTLVLSVTGEARLCFWILVLTSGLVVIVLLLVGDPAAHVPTNGRAALSALGRTIRSSYPKLLTIGLATSSLLALRAARIVILPLWGVTMGMPAAQVTLIIGIAGALELSLFFVGGIVMDRLGRVWGAVPSAGLFGVGMLLLAFTSALDEHTLWFTAAALTMAVANGIGTGIQMVLGSDLAPVSAPSSFLGAWRFTMNLGGASAPLLVSVLSAASSLTIATGAIGLIGVAGAAALWWFLTGNRAPGRSEA